MDIGDDGNAGPVTQPSVDPTNQVESFWLSIGVSPSNHRPHDPKLDRKGVREFGIVTGGVLALIFGLFLPWILERAYPYWPWIVWAVLGSWAVIAPMTLRPVYNIWMKFALLLGNVTTPVILGVVFYLVFFPVAMIFRILRKDAMNRKLDENSPTYRVSSDEISQNSLEKPF